MNAQEEFREVVQPLCRTGCAGIELSAIQGLGFLTIKL